MKPKYLDFWITSYYVVTYIFLKSNNFIRFFNDIYIYLFIYLFKILLYYLI